MAEFSSHRLSHPRLVALSLALTAAWPAWSQSGEPSGVPSATPAPLPTSKSGGSTAQGGTQRVEVSGKRSEDEQRRQATAAKIVIGREELDKFGDTSLGEVMKRLPGVTTDGRPGRGGNPRMRGLGAGYTQILIDGERVQGGLSLDSISPDQVERIEILRAPTAETGARAIGGTINIITREGFTKRLNDLKLGVGVEHGWPGGMASWSRDDSMGDFSYNVALSAWRRLGEDLSQTETRDPDSQQLERNQTRDQRHGLHANARLQWRLSETDFLSVMPMAVVGQSRAERQAAFSHEPAACEGQFSGLLCQSHSSSEGDFSMLRLNSMWRTSVAGWRLETRGGVGSGGSSNDSQRQETRDRASGATDLVSEHSRSSERSLNLNLKASKLLENEHNLVWGLEADAARRQEDKTQLLNGVSRYTDGEGSLTASTRRLALYGQDEWNLTPQWALHGGLRWEGIQTHGDALGSQAAVDNRSSVTTPLLHALWRPEPKSRDQVRVSVTRSYRSPTLSQLVAWPSIVVDNKATTPDRAGNPGLQPELATGLDVALERYPQQGGLFSVNVFYRHINEVMRSVTSLEQVPWSATPRYVSRPQNVGRATTQGVEMEAKGRLSDWQADWPQLDLRANLSLFASKVEGVPGPHNRLDSQPGGTLNLGADWKIKDLPLTVGSSLSVTPGYTTRLSESQWLTQPTKRVWDAYALVSLASGWRLRLSASNLAPLDTGSTSQVEDEWSQTISPTHVTWRAQLEIKL